MALYPDYATVDDLKRHLRIPGVYEGTLNTDEDVVDDLPLAAAITAASRAVDLATNRQFGLADSPTAYIYTPEYNPHLHRYGVQIDDLMTVSGIAIFSDSSNTNVYDTEITSYIMHPRNAEAKGKPWNYIAFDRSESIWCRADSLEVTAQWGWSDIPTTITGATLIQAARFFKRRDAPFGVAGSPDMGNELRLLAKLDPDVAVMVSPYKKWYGGV